MTVRCTRHLPFNALAAMAWLAVAPIAGGQCALSFATSVNYAAGVQPYAIAIADLNGDGRLDVAVADFAVSNNVSVRLGNGNGAFGPAINYSAGRGPTYIAIGDLNGDGLPDLAVANWGSDDVSVLLGNGNGTFGLAVNYAAGDGPKSVVIGDFNGDGHPDLAVANVFSDNISILLGHGNGSFSAAVSFAVGLGPISLAIGDLNADGRADLVSASHSSGNVTVLLGDGNGSFSSVASYGAGSNPISVAIGDLNGDGKHDLAVANDDSANVSVLLGNGDGSFGAAVNYGINSNAFSVAIGDLNGDGKLDLAVTNYGGDPFLPGDVSVLPGNGNGTFGPSVSYGTGSAPVSVAIADFDRDGRPDLAVANYFSNDVSILLDTRTSIAQQPINQSIAPGQTATFNVSTLGASSYQWRHRGVPLVNGGHFSGVLTNTLTVTNVTSAEAGPYDVQIIGGCHSGEYSKPAMLCVMASVCKGDFNNDGLLNASDIPAIVSAMLAGQTCP